MLPFLLVAYFLIEYVERTQSEKLEKILGQGGRFGYIPGSILGLIPQCGFSGMAANLYAGNMITIGTLMAVFISTSDEALPLLIASPERWRSLVMLLILKFIFAVFTGFFCDNFIKRLVPDRLKGGFRGNLSEVDCHDHNEEESLVIATLRHTGIIMIWIFVILLAINLVTAFCDMEKLSLFLEKAGSLQIFAAALIGLIPNCASSVFLTQMYAAGNITFAAMFAGLCSGSGIGTLVLLKAEKNKRRAVGIVALMYIFGVLFGLLLSLFRL